MSARKCDLSPSPQVGGLWKDLNMRMHAMAAPSRLGLAALAVALSLGLAACSSSSSTSSAQASKSAKSSTAWYNPAGWFESGPEKGDPAPIDGTAPDVADVPNRPDAKANAAAQRKELAQGLIADRDNARYTDEELRGRPAGAPPPPVSATPRATPTPSFPTPSAAPRTGVEPAELPAPPAAAKPQAAAEPAQPAPAVAAASPEPAPAAPVAVAAVEPVPAAAQSAPAAPAAAGENINVVPGAMPMTTTSELAPAPRPAAAAAAAAVSVTVAAAAPPAPAAPPVDAPATNLMQDAFTRALAQAEAGNRAPVSPPAAVAAPALAGGPSPAQVQQAAVSPAAVAGFPPVGAASPEFPGTGRQTPVAQINFAAGSAKLPADAGASLRRAADAWRQAGGLLRIVGRAAPVEADRTGRDVMASFTLAMNRAEAVGRELARIGVSPAALQIDGQGGDPGARVAATEIILEN